MGTVYVSRDDTRAIAHFGRRGMKWGQHIFGESDPRATYNRKTIKNASNEELREFISRKQLEKQYLEASGSAGAIHKLLAKVENTLIEKAGQAIGGKIFEATSNALSSIGNKQVKAVNEPKNTQKPAEAPKKKKKKQSQQKPENNELTNKQLNELMKKRNESIRRFGINAR